MSKYIIRCSMTTYYQTEEVEAESYEEACRKAKEAWANGTLTEDRQEFDVDDVESFDDEEETHTCTMCGATDDEDDVTIITVTDHPGADDGDYCTKCNPHNKE